MHTISHERSLDDVIRDLKDGRNSNENFGWLFERYHQSVFWSFVRNGISSEDSRDLAQEVFLAAFRSIHDLRTAAHFQTWLFSIGRNTLRNEIERQRAKKRFGCHLSAGGRSEEAIAPGLATLADVGPRSDVLRQMLASERLAKVTEALGQLPTQMRRCAQLRIVEDRSYAEISAIIGISINTVKAHLHQAKKTLKDKLSRCEHAELTGPMDSGAQPTAGEGAAAGFPSE